jgi:hypothetical protein
MLPYILNVFIYPAQLLWPCTKKLLDYMGLKQLHAIKAMEVNTGYGFWVAPYPQVLARLKGLETINVWKADV